MSGCAGPSVARQVNLNKRTPAREPERADLAIRHPPARWQSVGLAQLTLLEPVRGDLPTADRAVSAE